MPTIPHSIYAITHREFSGLSHVEQVDRLISAGARLIQIREKSLPAGELLVQARLAAKRCRAVGATLILNDDPELAVEANVDGVHVGQGDLSPAEARRIVGPDRIVGVSTHNVEQFLAALDEPVDYIAVGPVFGTTTKDNADPETGLEFVAEAWERLDGRMPLVAIGGIDAGNLARLMAVAPGVIPAVIGAIMKAPEIGAALRELEALRRDHSVDD
ncbi:thiamine phosphate synthase [bacterium]|nr:thiamine phosphate synthase [bacterium]